MICLLVMTDGRRDCIERTIPSALANLHGPITRRLIHDDSGDEKHRAWLLERFGRHGFELIPPAPTRQGFGGAIRRAWDYLATVSEPFIFHLEDDFTFNRPVPLDDIAMCLADNPHLAQLALRRQPWNDEERAAGGIIEQHPEDFVSVIRRNHWWLEHRRFFTTNPSLYRRTLTEKGWPSGQHSEGMFSQRLLASSPQLRFGFWGSRDSGEAVIHIGNERVGVGY